jgi:hypothetical protein
MTHRRIVYRSPAGFGIGLALPACEQQDGSIGTDPA